MPDGKSYKRTVMEGEATSNWKEAAASASRNQICPY
jgi:hypothetical protein